MLNWRRPFGGRRRIAAPETKDSRVGALIAVGSGGQARWTPRDLVSLTAAGFTQNPVAYRCVRMIAEAAAFSIDVHNASGQWTRRCWTTRRDRPGRWCSPRGKASG